MWSGCSTPTADRPPVDMQRLQTPEGYTEWKQRFDGLSQKVVEAKERYVQESSLAALQAYEVIVRESLDHGFAFYRAYRQDQQGTLAKETIATIIPFLNTMANMLMDVAEEYAKQQNPATGTSIAAEIITHYTDLPLLSAQLRAQTLLFEQRYRQDQ